MIVSSTNDIYLLSSKLIMRIELLTKKVKEKNPIENPSPLKLLVGATGDSIFIFYRWGFERRNRFLKEASNVFCFDDLIKSSNA